MEHETVDSIPTRSNYKMRQNCVVFKLIKNQLVRFNVLIFVFTVPINQNAYERSLEKPIGGLQENV